MWARCQRMEQSYEGCYGGPAAVLSHSAHCPSQISQHATGAPMSLSRTAGETRPDDLAAGVEELPDAHSLL
jgi:hypothetical protein